MTIEPKDYRVGAGRAVRLKKWPTLGKPFYRGEKQYRDILARQQSQLDKLQKLLYADRRHALLLIMQGMDAAGKDSAIGHIFASVNPEGCEVFSFGPPSAEELRHDFLWRAVCRLPERGRIGIFNRSYYEEVLVVRVHPQVLAAENLPHVPKHGATLWKERFRSITELESHLCRNGTVVVKIFLHLSYEEQRKRFLARIDEADKNWKFSLADIQERQFWKHYMDAYAACLAATSSHAAPWYIVPADDKKNAHLIISEILMARLKKLDMAYPKPGPTRHEELIQIREELGE
jgi:PPK2 family polyphosphate:nucleotide phosphotransferase